MTLQTSKKRYIAENYRIVLHVKTINDRTYCTAINYDFGIEHHELLKNLSESEKLLSTARLIIGIQAKISERLARLDRNHAAHPVPMNADDVMRPKLPDTLSIGEAAELLGEQIHNVRRWADQGKIPFQTTPSGHRRFPRAAIIKLAQKRVSLASDEPNEENSLREEQAQIAPRVF